MFLDGMGDQLSRLYEKNQCSYSDHTEGDPLDGIEKTLGWVGLTKECQEELDCSCSCKCESYGVAMVSAPRELAKKEDGKERRCNGGIKRYGVQRDWIRRDAHTPRKRGGKAGVTAFSEMSESEKGPGERGAGRPRVESVEEGKIFEAEIDHRRDESEDDAGSCERGHHDQEDWVINEVVEVREDQQQAGECKGREESEETGVPELVRIETNRYGGTETEAEGGDESHGGEDAEGRKQEVAGVDEIGVHLER
jgi:hypothetical protein